MKIKTLYIFPDELRAGDTVVHPDGERNIVLTVYRPDWRNGSVCVAASIGGDDQIDSYYYNLKRTLRVERESA